MTIPETLDYNTRREKLKMPEYGRNILKMVERLKAIPDRERRSEQARAVIKSMEILNPGVHAQEDFEHKLWDHLYMIAGFDLDVDAPYPSPVEETFNTHPVQIPMKGTRIKATHYGRNIEKIIDLVASQKDSEVKTALLQGLATYMRQQYLIWNKDSVSDETIFNDIVKLSDGRITIPQGLTLGKISESATFAKPTLGVNVSGADNRRNRGGKNRNNKKKQHQQRG